MAALIHIYTCKLSGRTGPGTQLQVQETETGTRENNSTSQFLSGLWTKGMCPVSHISEVERSGLSDPQVAYTCTLSRHSGRNLGSGEARPATDHKYQEFQLGQGRKQAWHYFSTEAAMMQNHPGVDSAEEMTLPAAPSVPPCVWHDLYFKPWVQLRSACKSCSKEFFSRLVFTQPLTLPSPLAGSLLSKHATPQPSSSLNQVHRTLAYNFSYREEELLRTINQRTINYIDKEGSVGFMITLSPKDLMMRFRTVRLHAKPPPLAPPPFFRVAVHVH